MADVVEVVRGRVAIVTLEIITAHAGAASRDAAVVSWHTDGPTITVVDGSGGMLPAYQKGYEGSEADIIAFLHDDLIVRDPPVVVWDRVMAEFNNPKVGLVGFGGAVQHGTRELYKTPYDYRQLGRVDYRSNTDDAEVHGERFRAVCEVAVLDGFALIVRRTILEKAGGWPIGTPIGYSLYDYWLACEAHRQGYRIHLVGVKCWHMGGQTAVKLGKAEGQGKAHEDAHRWLYERYQDVLPWRTVPL